MALVTVDEVRAYLPPLTGGGGARLVADNDSLDEAASIEAMVLGRLATLYDVAGWTTPATTPDLVRAIVAGLVASRRYQRYLSETVGADGAGSYALRLERQQLTMLDQLCDQVLVLVDVAEPARRDPAWFPTDESAAEQVYDGLGRPVGLPGDNDLKFRMSDRW